MRVEIIEGEGGYDVHVYEDNFCRLAMPIVEFMHLVQMVDVECAKANVLINEAGLATQH